VKNICVHHVPGNNAPSEDGRKVNKKGHLVAILEILS